jgi:AbrB family looped-hinge helix DNA binding protein
MPSATLTEKGQIVIPAKIRARYGLTPGTQLEFVDDGTGIRLLVRRTVPRSDPEDGYGLIKVPPARRQRSLLAFDAAATLRRRRRSRT